MKIVAGILTDDIEELEKRVQMTVGLVEWVQIDFIDGEYADNLTVAPFEVSLKSFQEKGLKFEAHLMVSEDNLSEWLRQALEAGFNRISTQIESIKDLDVYISLVKESGREIGVSLDLDTRVEIIELGILKKLDVVQIMTVGAGFSGQEFVHNMLWKVRELRELRNKNPELKFLIEVDGGVNEKTIKMVKDEGVDLAEVNSGLYNKGEFSENLKKLDEKIRT